MLAYQQRGKSTHVRESGPSRRGITLVEMMVAITITLIMIVALTQAFQSISESVSDSRAMISLTESTRKTAMTLQRDLDGLTVPARPWPEAASGLGYLEIVEGFGSDYNPQPTTPAGGDQQQQSYLHLLGDFDDAIMFTSRGEDEPFVGRIQKKYLVGQPNSTNANLQEHEAFDSPLAEVIWWTNFDSFVDADGNGFQSPTDSNETDPAPATRKALELHKNESLVLRRRALLIRPDLNNSSGHLNIALSGGNNPTDRQKVSHFMANNDVSVRVRPVTSSSGTITYYLAANTLADLTRRENRVAHISFDNNGAYLPVAFETSDSPRYSFNRNAPPILYESADPIGYTTSQFTTYSGANVITGDSTMLGGLLAFDVKVYDPQAPVLAVKGVATVPTSRGVSTTDPVEATETYPPLTYPPGHTNYDPTPREDDNGNTITVVGTGAFVDLNYGLGYPGASSDVSLFSGYHADSYIVPQTIPWSISKTSNFTELYTAYTYDTWSWDYERDGINQDRVDEGSGPYLIDQGTDGLDSDNNNGVDDVAERETSPPYPHPLRGVQISIRVHDNATRQVRQFSVVSDFTPE